MTLVELFHLCLDGVGLPLTVESPSSFLELGEDSGVRLWVYLWPFSGVTGVGGWLPRKWKSDCRWRTLFGRGSEDGFRETAFIGGKGVAGGAGDLPVIFLANFRKGDIDLDMVLVVLGALLERDALGGVARKPFLVDEVATDALDPVSL